MANNPDAIQRHETAAPAPTRTDFAPEPIKYTAESSSASAAINTVRADAANGNMLNNMRGGWISGRSRRSSRRSTRRSSRNKHKLRGGRSRSRSRSRSRHRQGAAFKTRVSRRLRIRMVQRRIKKRNAATAKLQMRGGSGELNAETNKYTVPQHGHSCGQGELNCAGNEASVLLAANNQMIANAHGDN